jgi:hypothetical protein
VLFLSGSNNSDDDDHDNNNNNTNNKALKIFRPFLLPISFTAVNPPPQSPISLPLNFGLILPKVARLHLDLSSIAGIHLCASPTHFTHPQKHSSPTSYDPSYRSYIHKATRSISCASLLYSIHRYIMATEFVMPQPYTTSPTSQYMLYGTQSQQVSPTNSAVGTPNNGSPTSPRSSLAHMPHHVRQLRPPKSPLYVPAVLRPTDPPTRRVNKPSPLTPPQSMHSSFESLDKGRILTRRGTGDSGKSGLGQITENEWVVGFGTVTALPTKDHWKVRELISAFVDLA